jgi:hypothetical protein
MVPLQFICTFIVQYVMTQGQNWGKHNMCEEKRFVFGKNREIIRKICRAERQISLFGCSVVMGVVYFFCGVSSHICVCDDETKTNRGVYNNTHLFPKFLCIITLKMSHKVLPEEVWGGLLPKKETQSFEFVQNHPEWDGRGIVVGILDTGVDPGAIGLQQTTDGKPKVIDIIDCSGSGDVVMHGPFQVDVEGVLPGIGGQKLKVNPSWNNPSGNYRVGIKVHRQ